MTATPASGRLATARILAAGLAAALAGGVVLAGRATGLLEGPVGLLLLCLTVLVLPSARTLSGRIAVNGAIAMGGVIAFWWVDLTWLPWGRVAWIWAVVVAGAAAWVVGGQARRARLWRLVPDAAPIDGVPVLGVGAAAYFWRNWLDVADPGVAFGILARNWDNVAHFNMSRMIRLHGQTIERLGPSPDGTHYASSEYPQGFHSLAATVMEALHGPTSRGLQDDIVLYVRSVGFIAILGALVTVAAVCALPFMRQRNLLAFPAAVFVFGVCVMGPGAIALSDSFPNFLLAIELAVCATCLCIAAPVFQRPVHAAAIAACIVGVASGWILLLVIVLPVAAMGVFPPGRDLRAIPRRELIAFGAIVVATAYALLHTFRQVSAVSTSHLENATGGVTQPPFTTAVMLALLAGVAGLIMTASPGLAPTDRRLARIAMVPVPLAAAFAPYALWRIAHGQVVSYYFSKLLFGVWFAALIMVALLVARFGARWSGDIRLGWRTVAASVVLALMATQAFGFTYSYDVTKPDVVPRAPVIELRPFHSQPSWTDELRAAAVSAPDRNARHELFMGLKSTQPEAPVLLRYQWYMSLTGTWTEKNQAHSAAVDIMEGGGPGATVAAARQMLEDPTVTIIAPPADAGAICRVLQDPNLCARVGSW